MRREAVWPGSVALAPCDYLLLRACTGHLARYDTNIWYQVLAGRRTEGGGFGVANVLDVGCTPPVKELDATDTTADVRILLRLYADAVAAAGQR